MIIILTKDYNENTGITCPCEGLYFTVCPTLNLYQISIITTSANTVHDSKEVSVSEGRGKKASAEILK